MFVHGEYVLDRLGDLIISYAKGPWNLACVEQFRQEYRLLSADLRQKPLCDLIVLHGESLMPPDAAAEMRDAVKSAADYGLTNVAFVLIDSTVQNSTRWQFEAIYDTTGISREFFNSIEDALNWLEAKGCNFDKQEFAIPDEVSLW